MTNDTRPIPLIVTMDEILAKTKAAFLETQRELARIARQRIDGDATQSKRIIVESKSRTETP